MWKIKTKNFTHILSSAYVSGIFNFEFTRTSSLEADSQIKMYIYWEKERKCRRHTHIRRSTEATLPFLYPKMSKSLLYTSVAKHCFRSRTWKKPINSRKKSINIHLNCHGWRFLDHFQNSDILNWHVVTF